MAMPRSTFYDGPRSAVDDTALVEAMFSICDYFEVYGYRRIDAALRPRLSQPRAIRATNEPAIGKNRT